MGNATPDEVRQMQTRCDCSLDPSVVRVIDEHFNDFIAELVIRGASEPYIGEHACTSRRASAKIRRVSIFVFFLKLFAKNPAQGAATSIFAATAPGLTSGAYLADCAIKSASAESLDPAMIEALWNVSMELTSK